MRAYTVNDHREPEMLLGRDTAHENIELFGIGRSEGSIML